MARPIKKGLDYFSFDVDFFDDGKIMAISKEFGVKGEVVAVRLLCAIFREGYFLQWNNDTNRVKLSMGLPSVSDALLEQIVRGLVRWGFFDKDLFGSAGVLTSRGIQKRYFSSVRRRKGEGDLPYLLLDKRELLQAETGLMATKTPLMYAETPKVKESKENIKKKKKEKEKSEKKSEEEARCLVAADVLRLYNKALRIFGEKYPDWECKLRYARKMTQERERNCSILAERFTETEIKQAWWNACLNPFCNGRTKDRHKPADIDWMLQEKIFVRLLEGSLG